MKLLVDIESPFTLLLFLTLNLGDCLHWYTLPLSNIPHRGLYATMVTLSLLNCWLLVRSLNALRRIWDKLRLKLVSVPAETETKFEVFVRWSFVSLVSNLCAYACATFWGGIYLSHGPFVGSGNAALLILVACEIVGITAAFRLAVIKRSMRPKKAKAPP